MSEPRRPIRIANCSGFFGDRLAAAGEMVRGGPIDVLTGDWLAELTMLILARQRMKHGAGSGYARTFLTQMKDVLGDCLARDIKVVTNAGGLDPQGLADALREFADQSGLDVRIAVVTGDDLAPRVADLIEVGEEFQNLDTGEKFADLGLPALAANAYLGAGGITAALQHGADVVICGRVTDAAVAIGPAAWWHDWDYRTDLDPLAGALVAGHIIECGAQATGGNYSFFTDVPGLEHPGFPIAEIAADGTTVITKHPGTGGLVSVGTVTSQLLYEVGGPLYLNPDVTADFGTIELAQVGRDRVRVSGTRGLPPPQRLKVSLNYLGGFRNSMTLVLTGLDIEAKADLALRTVCGLELADTQGIDARDLADRSTLGVGELSVELVRGDQPDPTSISAAQAHLRISVKDSDPNKVGKAFTAPAVESALATYPGMFPTAPPAPGSPYGVFWPTTIGRDQVRVTVTIDGGDALEVPQAAEPATGPQAPSSTELTAEQPGGDTVAVPLGWVLGARSGDKGGNANVGVWIPDPVEVEAIGLAVGEIDSLVAPVITAGHDVERLWAEENPLPTDDVAQARADAAYAWLHGLITPTTVGELIPEARGRTVQVHPLPRLRAINIVITGILGRGVSENTLLDPQAKGLGEYLRSRVVDVPTRIMDRPEIDSP